MNFCHEFPALFSLQYRVWKYVWHFLIWQISFAHANVVVHKIELKALFLWRLNTETKTHEYVCVYVY